MFFYLIKNSSFLKEEKESILFKTLLYGIVMYISFHAIINCSFTNTSLFNTYFWTILLIDVSVIYYTYKSDKNGEVTINSNVNDNNKINNSTNKNISDETPLIVNPVLDNIKINSNTISSDSSNIKHKIKILDDVNTYDNNDGDSDVYEEIELPLENKPDTKSILNDDDILNNIQNNYNVKLLEEKTEKIVDEKLNSEQLINNETDNETDIDINMSDFEKLLD
jgi:hypothetical protein